MPHFLSRIRIRIKSLITKKTLNANILGLYAQLSI